jgi:hypothetical protein
MNKYRFIHVPLNWLSKKVSLNKILPLILIFLIINSNSAFGGNSTCSYFYPKLSELPHAKLIQNNNGFKSLMDGKWTSGCEIIFKSHDSIVSGDKVYNTFQSFINAPGWAIDNKLSADGPGSSSVTIERDKNKCAIIWSQHALIDDKTGEHKQSSDIEMIIQCSSK